MTNQLITPGFGATMRTLTRTGVDTQIVGLDLNPAGAEVLGTGDATNGLDVDVTRIQVFPAVSTASITQLTSSATSQQLLASNAARKGLVLFNDSTAICYVKYGTTASTASYTVKMAAGAYWEMPSPTYTGRIDAIWASANGVLASTEL